MPQGVVSGGTAVGAVTPKKEFHTRAHPTVVHCRDGTAPDMRNKCLSSGYKGVKSLRKSPSVNPEKPVIATQLNTLFAVGPPQTEGGVHRRVECWQHTRSVILPLISEHQQFIAKEQKVPTVGKAGVLISAVSRISGEMPEIPRIQLLGVLPGNMYLKPASSCPDECKA